MGFDTSGKPIYYSTYNRDAAIGTGAAQLQDLKIYNLEGENITLHEWDGGAVRTSHREFEGRATQKDDPQKEIDHATHVGATLIGAGINARAKGMAPKAKLNAYDWNDDLAEMTTAALSGALLSNHSYGVNGGFVQGNFFNGIFGWYWFGGKDDTEYIGYGHYGSIDSSWDYMLTMPLIIYLYGRWVIREEMARSLVALISC
ncbi:MAG: hypothetical protein ACTTJM_03580 [Bergeyella cardium]